MHETDIVIRGAREHNLRGVDLRLPRNQLIAMTGVSGSGKSSLAFDTLYAEGQRRYVESLSSYARQFLGQMPKPEVDSITGLAPSISIQQKTSGRNPRSTVGTITEIYDYLRVLFARVGLAHCPECDRPITAQTSEQILDALLRIPEGTRFLILAPVVQRQKGEYKDLFEDLLKQGYLRARVDGRVVSLSENLQLDRQMRHSIDVVIDRLQAGSGGRTRLAEAVEGALRLGNGNLILATEHDRPQEIDAESDRVAEGDADESAEAESAGKTAGKSPRGGKSAGNSSGTSGNRAPAMETTLVDRLFSARYACTHCGTSYEPPSPQLFSFNSPQGMCLDCNGLGIRHDFDLALLIPDEGKSLAKGAVELLGPLKEIGKWRRHIYEGVARALEIDHAMKEGSALSTPWRDLPEKVREALLYGTGDRNITLSWRHRGGVWKHGTTYAGIIPELLESYRTAKNPMRRRQLEKYLKMADCKNCGGTRLNRQARGVRITSSSYSPDISSQAPPPAATARKKQPKGARGKKAAGVTPASVPPVTAAPPVSTESPVVAPPASVAMSLSDVCGLTISEASRFFEKLELDETGAMIAQEAIKEIRGRLGFLLRCGLDYLTLDRTAPTLSGGETQRIRLAGQIGCGLVGVVYILDEPSIGLHPRDNDKLLDSLLDLRDQGNTVIVVEHDEDTMRAADHIVDFGPGPGVRGGEVVAQGTLREIAGNPRSVTGQFLSGSARIEIPERRPSIAGKQLVLKGANHNNLRDVDVTIPLGAFVCVTGVSGSGKSSLVNDILWEVLNRDLNRGEGSPGAFEKLTGLELLDKAIDIDQSPIGRTPRSNPATYVKLFDLIRDLYSQLPEAKIRGWKPGRFSFNVEMGRCEACEGNGSKRLEMDFLADVWVTCPVCNGNRFKHETLEVRFKGKTIAEVLDMDVQQALVHFENVAPIAKLLQTLHDVGLDYLKLGQASPTLSGGEAQRVKLARELGKRSTGRTIYLLDEPTTGLHFADVKKLLEVLRGLVDKGNTVLVVEHNLDVIKTADWVLDLGPEGGAGGGRLVIAGTPETVAAHPGSHTGRALRKLLPGFSEAIQSAEKGETEKGDIHSSGRTAPSPFDASRPIVVKGASQHNLQNVDIELPRHQMSVFCGPSGSGKSSLAMDTLYAEGQRRYVESLSAYARQFLGQMPKPRVDHVSGLSPAIAIEQKTVGNTPRSTVGTVTEIYDYLRILFARLGQAYCPQCDIPVETQSTDQVVAQLLARPDQLKLLLLAPQEVEVGDSYAKLWDRLRGQGYRRVRVNGTTYTVDEVPELDRRSKHQVEIVVDRVTVGVGTRKRFAESVELALDLGRGWLRVAEIDDTRPEPDWRVDSFSLHRACQKCGTSFEDLSPNNFSFNSVLGWCQTCEGLGTQQGTDMSALIGDSHRTLSEGVVTAWPDPRANTLFARFLAAISRQTGLPLDVPFDRLDARHKRIILFGCGDRWIEVAPEGDGGSGVTFRMQYKGLYPALDDLGRMSYAFGQSLASLVGEVPCPTCQGSRLRSDAAAVRFTDRTLQELCELPLGECLTYLKGVKLKPAEKKVAGDLLREVTARMGFLVDVGLHYLTLSRTMPTLSGGESQRIRLAGQVGRSLTGVLYVLDEPTIGLHPRDNGRLLKALKQLRDLGNTLVLVEHDREVLDAADRLYDFGPGAGRFGGTIVGEGTPREVRKLPASLTGGFLSGREQIAIPLKRRMPAGAIAIDFPNTAPATDTTKPSTPPQSGAPARRGNAPRKSPLGKSLSKSVAPGGGWLEVLGAIHHNLRDAHLRIPLGTLTCVTGVSGSGKSSLVEDTLARAVARRLHGSRETPGKHREIKGLEQVNKIIVVDQQPLGTTPASNPATYTGVFELIRELFTRLPDAKMRGFRPGRFSFNRPGGRCEACEGNGQKKIEMHFLPDVWVTCEECKGRRFNAETLTVLYHGKSIADVLEMSIGQARELFENIPKIRAILATLCAVGLDYLTLGQSAATLSGGEAQRVKLAAELARPQTGRTLYILDEPTTGLHFDDIRKLLKVLHSLVELGNTVVVIEHNLDVIKTADWIIDLGPEAGVDGGWIVAEGTPEEVVDLSRWSRHSHTGELLAPLLKNDTRAELELFNTKEAAQKRSGDLEIEQVGKTTKMPWQTDGRVWHLETRLSHTGKPCRWEASALAYVMEKVEAVAGLRIDWNERSVIEVTPMAVDGTWFLHALTGDEWILTLKFRVPRKTFQEDTLARELALKSFDDIDEVPVYGRAERVRINNTESGLQEVTITVHWLKEIDTPAFASFLEKAFQARLGLFKKPRVVADLKDETPWARLGRRWHTMQKGFPPKARIAWKPELLIELMEILDAVYSDAEVNWSGKDDVVYTLRSGIVSRLYTKRAASVDLQFVVPIGKVNLRRIANLGAGRYTLRVTGEYDLVMLTFTKATQFTEELGEFLAELNKPV